MSSPWPTVELGYLLSKSTEEIAVDPHHRYKQVTVRLWGNGVVQRDEVFGAQIKAERRGVVRTGQLVLSRIDARNGAIGIVPEWLDGALVSSDFPAYTPDVTRLLPGYLAWLSRTRAFVDLCRRASEGTTNRIRLKEDRFLTTTVPLPPITEQRRVVARLDAVSQQLAIARGLRDATRADLDGLSTAAVERLIQFDCWPTVPLQSILREDSQNGLAPRPAPQPPGTPILRISAATSRRDGAIDESDVRFLELDDRAVEKYRLLPGDLLACRFNGNLGYVGRFATYRGYSQRVQVYPDKLIRFRIDTDRALPDFVRLALNSPAGRAAVESFCATTAGNIGISAGDLKTVPVPVPPLPDQRRIVAEIAALEAEVAQVRLLQDQTAAELDSLMPAVLDRAFSGRF